MKSGQRDAGLDLAGEIGRFMLDQRVHVAGFEQDIYLTGYAAKVETRAAAARQQCQPVLVSQGNEPAQLFSWCWAIQPGAADAVDGVIPQFARACL